MLLLDISNNICLAWGKIAVASHNSKTVTFATTFTTAPKVVATIYGAGATSGNTASSIVLKSSTKTDATIVLTEYSNSGTSGFNFCAIGY